MALIIGFYFYHIYIWHGFILTDVNKHFICFIFFTGRPQPEVRWMVNGVLVDDQYEHNTGDVIENRLLWPSIQRTDLNSIFTCQAINTQLVEPRENSYILDLHRKCFYLNISNNNFFHQESSFGRRFFCTTLIWIVSHSIHNVLSIGLVTFLSFLLVEHHYCAVFTKKLVLRPCFFDFCAKCWDWLYFFHELAVFSTIFAHHYLKMFW